MIFKKTPVDKKYDAAGDDEDGLSSEKYPPLGNFNTVRQQGGCFGCGAIRKISSYPIVHPKSGWGLMDKNGKKLPSKLFLRNGNVTLAVVCDCTQCEMKLQMV